MLILTKHNRKESDKMVNFLDLEEKWQKRWKDNGIFESNLSDKEKFYINVAYPYPSGAMHIGHGRTYTVPDVIARFKRMQGYEVLFPMAFHVTGTPVIGVSDRIANKDPGAITLYRDLYKVPEDVLERFTDPYEIVRYFSNEYTDIMNKMGYSIDWRRRFTTVDPHYNKFITWQYNKLKEKGLVGKGKHPVKYCLNCDNPVGDHDLLEGVNASISEFVILKFKLTDDKNEEVFIPTATLRPETVYGVTNIWINTEVEYIRAKVNGEKWVISSDCLSKLTHQNFEIEVYGKVKGSELVEKKAKNPINNQMVSILPASFVDPDFGTGIVMSVPAHAPFDYVALEDLKKAEPKYRDIEPIPVIGIKKYGKIPAKDVSLAMEISDQNDPKLEAATEELYSAEFSSGSMLVGYEGLSVNEAREKVRNVLASKGLAEKMYEFSQRPVVCRCNTKVYVKILKDQWFLKYSDQDWKDKVSSCLSRIDLVPNEIRADFERTIGWLNDWACTRRVGLGTKLPWDDEWIVEPLSDSTIYMAYYCIAHRLKIIDPNNLDDSTFDFIFLGKESFGKDVDKDFKDNLKEIRDEFLFWYPYDDRLSAKDLVSNHLTFQLFHHTAIFPIDLWPKGMAVFGMGLLEGNKMSSSKGNVVLLCDAIEKHGADTVRMFLMGSAEPWQDFDWREEFVSATKRQISRFWDISNEIIENGKGKKYLKTIDRWLLNRLQMRIKMVTEALEGFQTRQALQHAYFGIESDLKWYRRRTDWDRDGAKWTLNFLLNIWVRLLAPFIPYVSEEVWSEIGGGFVSKADYPILDDQYCDQKVDIQEEFLENVFSDINEIIKVIKVQPKKIILYTSPKWKNKVFGSIVSMEKREVGPIMSKVMGDPEIKSHGKEVSKFVQKAIQDLRAIPEEKIDLLVGLDEKGILTGAKEFLEKEFGCTFEIFDADNPKYDPKKKAKHAAPIRPAIFVED